MSTNRYTSLETLQHASNIENMLRLLCMIPNLQLLVKMDEENNYPFEHVEDGHYSKLLLGGNSLTIEFCLDV
ncbi:hypothetical protein G3N56_10265 [Desulfovibrio sulfodismutans]|uniref:Uncharacterized protein n=1 Tax=Desulfolutivibrio sulfodismutans TaxID=63561 RepID=A0A7K3NLP7_9BACT|nr:hypothetical protein [Desulfolutivibrio sulfodismutans]NDY57124.1 hypothetical protein [Desulfolutivibrio sulfodismutans]QLA12654.1 hypothetical protein GD606_10405 [Desulfolutivibrio sulfodismutans DSM 3696]